MRIHAYHLDTASIYEAADKAGATRVEVTQHGSRTHARAFEIKLYGSSFYRPNNRGAWVDHDDHAATWDEWGIALGHLFLLEPYARVADAYESAAHFHWLTGDRFKSLKSADQHRHHTFRYEGVAGTADNSYSIHRCTCGAMQRRGGWTS